MNRVKKKILCVAIAVSVLLLLSLSGTGTASSAEKEERYNTAILQLESWLEQAGQPVSNLEQVSDVFDSLGGYEMSRAFVYYTRILIKCARQEFDYDYNFWIQMLESNAAFQEYLGNTIKSPSIETTEDLLHYARAVDAEKRGDAAEAGSLYLKCLNYYDASVRYERIVADSNKSQYEKGRTLMEEGRIGEAIEAFEKANGYGDSLERIVFLKELSENDVEENSVTEQTAEVPAAGSTVLYGQYEQDGEESNGKEPIEWLVLDVQDDKILLISKYGLDSKPFSTKWEIVTWEDCSLRQWLNNDFYKTAFSEMEQSNIIDTETGSSGNTDKVFLLSLEEAGKYFGSVATENIRARVAATAYAVQNGAGQDAQQLTEEGRKSWWWWLRTTYGTYASGAISASGQSGTSNVTRVKGITQNGAEVFGGCVRPAVWTNIGTVFSSAQ